LWGVDYIFIDSDSEEGTGEGILEEERYSSDRVAWGTGRVAFRANLPTIQDMLAAGWPMSTVYQRVKGSLAGVSYRQFTTHVRKHFHSARRQPGRTYEARTDFIESAETAPAVKVPEHRRSANDEKPKATGRAAKFQPGPRVPDPKQLY
jgi:hypothetical protein